MVLFNVNFQNPPIHYYHYVKIRQTTYFQSDFLLPIFCLFKCSFKIATSICNRISYWFKTGTPTCLAELLKLHHYPIEELEHIVTNQPGIGQH